MGHLVIKGACQDKPLCTYNQKVITIPICFLHFPQLLFHSLLHKYLETFHPFSTFLSDGRIHRPVISTIIHIFFMQYIYTWIVHHHNLCTYQVPRIPDCCVLHLFLININFGDNGKNSKYVTSYFFAEVQSIVRSFDNTKPENSWRNGW